MYPTSDKYKQAITSHFRDGQNAILEFEKLKLEKRWVRSVSFSHILSDSEYLELGSIASKKVEVELNDLDGTLKNTQLSAQYFNLYHELAGEQVPIGRFKIDGNPDKSEKNVVKITAFDRLYYADVKYYCMLGEIYTPKDLLQDALSQCEIELASDDILSYVNMDSKQTFVPENLTCRQVISLCAEVTGCMAIMTRDDKLDFIPIVNNMGVAGELDIKNCYDMVFAEKDFVVDGMRYYESDDSYLKAGSGKKRIICLSSSNFLVNQQVLDNLYNRINGLTFRPFKCPRYTGDPSIDAGDLLTVQDIKGTNTYKIMPLIVSWKFNGGLQGTLENNASISDTVAPKNTTTLEQKINQTYMQRVGVTYAYNNDKIVLGSRETTLCDIKFANAYGNIPTGALGINGTFVPDEGIDGSDISFRFVSDDKELPFKPSHHLNSAGRYTISIPLTMYTLASGDHYFQAYASSSAGTFEVDPEQFTLHILTIGTGGGLKSPDTYLSEVFDKTFEIKSNLTFVPFKENIYSVDTQNPEGAELTDTFGIFTIQSALEFSGFIDHVNTSHVILNNIIDVNSINDISFNDRYIKVVDDKFVLNKDYNFVSVQQPIDQGQLRVVSIDTTSFKSVEAIEEI